MFNKVGKELITILFDWDTVQTTLQKNGKGPKNWFKGLEKTHHLTPRVSLTASRLLELSILPTLGAIAGMCYKGGNPYKNWQEAPPVSFRKKLFGTPSNGLDAQTLADRQEIHNAKLRSAAWGLIPDPWNTLYRLFVQDPVKLAHQRRDVQTGQRSLQSAIQHETNVRDAQLRVANVSMLGSGLLLPFKSLVAPVVAPIGAMATLIGLACVEEPESATFNSVI
ncbi:MAG: hypothetical protein ACKPIG_23370 [Microcystis panniformis]